MRRVRIDAKSVICHTTNNVNTNSNDSIISNNNINNDNNGNNNRNKPGIQLSQQFYNPRSYHSNINNVCNNDNSISVNSSITNNCSTQQQHSQHQQQEHYCTSMAKSDIAVIANINETIPFNCPSTTTANIFHSVANNYHINSNYIVQPTVSSTNIADVQRDHERIKHSSAKNVKYGLNETKLMICGSQNQNCDKFTSFASRDTSNSNAKRNSFRNTSCNKNHINNDEYNNNSKALNSSLNHRKDDQHLYDDGSIYQVKLMQQQNRQQATEYEKELDQDQYFQQIVCCSHRVALQEESDTNDWDQEQNELSLHHNSIQVSKNQSIYL